MNDLEFYVLINAYTENRPVLDFDNYLIKMNDDDTFIIEFNNQSDYYDTLNAPFYVYYIDEDYHDDYLLTLRLKLKDIFKEFNDPNLLKKDTCYQHLYGTTIDVNLKRLIIFLCNHTTKEQKAYLKNCPESVLDGISNYFNLIYDNVIDSNENDESYLPTEGLA